MSSLGSHFLLFYIIENNRLRQVKLESIGDLKLMGMLAEIIVNLVKKNTTSSKMANHIFYKIEDVNSTLDEYTLRCANTNTVFNVSIRINLSKGIDWNIAVNCFSKVVKIFFN